MARIDEVKENWYNIINELFTDIEKMTDFLRFAGQTYRHSFEDAALIYHENPNAKMIADFDTWNRIGRRIHKHTKSIAVFSEDNKCRYLFNLSQTYGRPAPKQWVLNESLAKSINQKYGTSYTEFKTALTFLTEIKFSEKIEHFEAFAEKIKLNSKQIFELQKSALSMAKSMTFVSDKKISEILQNPMTL